MNHRMIRCAASVALLLFTLIGIATISEKQNVFAEDSKAPENMVLVPGGKFLYGENKKETSLKAFYIDKYEVTNEDYKKIKTEHAFPSKEGKYPVREMSWFDADEYCKGAGKRLPTEEEWEKNIAVVWSPMHMKSQAPDFTLDGPRYGKNSSQTSLNTKCLTKALLTLFHRKHCMKVYVHRFNLMSSFHALLLSVYIFQSDTIQSISDCPVPP